jgi:hypothetical protein
MAKTSLRRRSRRSRRSSRKSSRKSRSSRKISRSRRRSFGTVITLEDGTVLTDQPNLNKSDKAIKQDEKYKKYLITLNKKLHKLNETVKKNHIFMTFGSFLLLLFILVYTSYDDIKNKSANELIYSVYTYLIGGSLSGTILGQHAIKDLFYELISAIRKALTYDHEFYEIKDNFTKLKKNGLIDEKMDYFFRSLEDDYNNFSKRNTTSSQQEVQNIKSFMNLLTDLTATHNEEMNTQIPEDYIIEISRKLEEFIKDYGSAKKQLDEELANPLLLNMIGKEGPPISAIFLVGNPGVGKTRFVKHFSEILKAKIYEFLPDRKNERREFIPWAKSAKEFYPDLSVFTQMALDAKKNKGPVILFIDEIDKKLSEELLTTMLDLLGDPKNRVARDPTLGLDIKLPRNIVVICASNKTLEKIAEADETYKPLLSRFIEIFIPDMSKEIQVKATTEYLESIYPDLKEEDRQFIKDVVYRTKFPGLRELINITNTYVRHLQAISTLSKYKKIQGPTEYRQEYLLKLEEQQKASETATEIAKETNTKLEEFDEEERGEREEE